MLLNGDCAVKRPDPRRAARVAWLPLSERGGESLVCRTATHDRTGGNEMTQHRACSQLPRHGIRRMVKAFGNRSPVGSFGRARRTSAEKMLIKWTQAESCKHGAHSFRGPAPAVTKVLPPNTSMSLLGELKLMHITSC